jgi:uncharacterized membrane protein
MTAANETLEVRIGSRWLLYIGVIAIVVGAAYFIKLAFDNDWITPAARVMLGGLVGFAMAYAGTRFVRAGYALYGQMVSGGGVALLYIATYGAFNYYQLISQPVAFALMCGVTVFGATLANRQRSQGLALMAVGGGFATPFLLPGDPNAETALFTYDAIIVAGTMYLAGRRDWPFLNLLSFVATGATFGTWAATFYVPAKFLSTEIFLTIFGAMFVYILRATRHSTSPMAETVRSVLWSTPVAYYFASLAVLTGHSAALLVFLLALSVSGAALAHMRQSSLVRIVSWLAAVVPLGGWVYEHAGAAWLAPGLVTVAAVYALTLISQFAAITGDDASWNEADIVLLHGNALFSAFAMYLFVDAVRADRTAMMVAGLAAWHGVLAWVLARRDRRVAVHAGALAFTMLAAATALQFDGAALTAAWAAEGCAVIWLGLRERRGWLRLAGAMGFIVAIGRLAVLLTDPPLAGQQVLLNERAACGLFIIALTYGLAWMHHRSRQQLGTLGLTDTSGAGPQSCDPPEVALALVGAKLLILAVACSEIAAYWAMHPPAGFTETAEFIAAFALVGTLIIWMGLSRREETVRIVGGLVFAEAALLLLALQFEVAGPGYRSVLNARVASGLLVIGLLYGLAALHRRFGAHVKLLEPQVGALFITANLLSLSMLTSEINAHWPLGSASESAVMAAQAMHAISWTWIGASLAWLGVARREAWTRYIGWGVLTIAALLVLDLDSSSVFSGYLVVANFRFTATAILVAALYWLAWLARQDSSRGASLVRAALILAANGFTLLFLTSETAAFWHLQDASRAVSAENQLARGAMQSVMWATYATGAIVVGIRRRYAPVRYFAMAVFALTIGKVFLVDMAELERVYRVVSVIGLGVMLLATSYLYQRFRHQLA